MQESPGQCTRVGISSAKRWRIEQFTVLSNNCSGWHVVKHPSSFISIEERKNRGSRNPATTKMERFVAISNGWKPLFFVTKNFIFRMVKFYKIIPAKVQCVASPWKKNSLSSGVLIWSFHETSLAKMSGTVI